MRKPCTARRAARVSAEAEVRAGRQGWDGARLVQGERHKTPRVAQDKVALGVRMHTRHGEAVLEFEASRR